MEMFLVLAALSLAGILVSAVLFATAVDASDAREKQQTAITAAALAPPQFFAHADAAARAAAPAGMRPGAAATIDIDALLLQIARHVQLEQAAAESFLHAPTRQSLHSRTASTLLN